MQNITILIFLLLAFWETNPISEQTLEHDIKSVTVFLNSAEIHRSSSAVLPIGKSDIILRGISNRILDRGMKISLSPGLKVYAVSIEDDLDAMKENEDWKNILNKREAKDAEIRTLSISIQILDKELEYLMANMRIGGDKGATYAQIDEGAKYFKERITKLQLAKDDENKKREKLHKEIIELSKEQAILQKKLFKISTRIRITVISETETESANALINIRYLVSNAVWKPYYSLRAMDKEQALTLEYQAQVYNDTGNDWDNKPLTLAIIDPSNDVSKPVMDAWVLDDNRYGNKFKSEGRLSNRKGSLRDKENNEKNPQKDILQIDDLSTRFEIKDLHLIPSDATPHIIDVTSYTKDANFYTLSIPKVKDGAFLIAQIPDWENLGLLDGPVNLYYNTVYQGVSMLDTRQINDTLDISLGKDNSFSVTRRKLASMSSEKLIGFNVKETLTYEFIVKNNKSESAKLELRDQIPVSADKDVSVKVLDLSGAKLDQLSGQLTWDVDLDPMESKRIILKFFVKYPKSKRGILRHNRKVIATPRYF